MDVILVQPVVALVAGILILIWPTVINYVIAAYLILTGLAGLLPHFQS